MPLGRRSSRSVGCSLKFCTLSAIRPNNPCEAIKRSSLLSAYSRFQELRQADAQCRYLLLVSRALPLLILPPDVRKGMTEWFKANLDFMATSEQGARARTYGNNITIWYHALVASHLSFVDPEEAVVYTTDTLRELMTRFPRPLDFFARELSRTRPRHYVLFTLEATFLLVSILVDPAESPFAQRDSAFLSYLAGLVHFAESVSGSDIEVDVDNDERYHLKLSWFKTMLDRLLGEVQDKSPEPDGSGWPGGWNQFARLQYGFI